MSSPYAQRAGFLPGAGRFAFAAAVLLVALAIRLAFFNSTTGDTTYYVIPWYERIVAVGYPALGESIPNARGELTGNYSPPYYYLLYIASWFDGVMPRLWLIKSISVAFELLAAFFAYRLARLNLSEGRSLLAASAVLLAPSVIANGAWWGQCDIIWVSLLLGSLYFILARRPYVALALFGVAISFKAPAIFLAPFLLMLFLRGDLRFRHFLVAPLAYGVMVIPAILAGRAPLEVLTVYLTQGGHFRLLALNAPNPYYFIANAYYDIAVPLGALATVVVLAALIWLPKATKAELDLTGKLLAATVFAAVTPFLLPKMHDRYFMAVDVFAILLAFHAPRLWFIPAMSQLSSLAAYYPIISWNRSGHTHIEPMTMPMAAMLNTLTVVTLVYLYWRTCVRRGEASPSAVRHFASASGGLAGAALLWLGVGVALGPFKANYCPADNPVVGFLCARWFPVDLTGAAPKYWIAFAAVALAGYVVIRFAISPLLEARGPARA